jgi:hypothetical protein
MVAAIELAEMNSIQIRPPSFAQYSLEEIPAALIEMHVDETPESETPHERQQ